MSYYVYLLASKKHGTLYLGVTNNIVRRVYEHRSKVTAGFTKRYGVDKLVWFESHPSRDQAFVRERQIKEWKRLWKLQLIEARNPNWVDLYDDLDRLLMEDEVRGLSEFLPGSRLSPG